MIYGTVTDGGVPTITLSIAERYWPATIDTGGEIMTQLLEKVLTEVYKLPPEKQDFIAAIILEELEDERRWDKAFAESQDLLAKLAEEVRADIKAGRVKKMGIDEL